LSPLWLEKGFLIMPEKHFYFSIGAAVGTAISYLIGKNRHFLQDNKTIFKALKKQNRHWFLYFPVVIFIVGLWGLIPDVIHALGILSKDVTRGEFFNVFFMHSWFEHIENINPTIDQVLNWVGELLLVSIAIGVMIFYIKEIKKSLGPKQDE
jgi:hypothetical protein